MRAAIFLAAVAFLPTLIVADARGAASGAFEIEIDPDAVSFHLTFHPEEGTSVGITRIVASDGTTLLDTEFPADSWEASAFSSLIVIEPIVRSNTFALSLPLSPRAPVVPGTYRIEYETDPPNLPPLRVSSAVRLDPGDTVAAGLLQTVDLHVHVLHPDPPWRDAAFADILDHDWRAALDRILTPHALAVGATSVSTGAWSERTRLGELDDERELREACQSARRAGREVHGRGAGDKPVLHVSLVAELAFALLGGGMAADSDALAGDDPEASATQIDTRGDTSGWLPLSLTGLSPVPGLLHADDSPDACVFIAERAWSHLETGLSTELLAANLLHELGHFVGLEHPSEEDGMTFDLLDDTPRCIYPDARSCGVAGGAGNIMFHSGDETTLPWTLSADQAWVLRRHPLFRPAPDPLP